MPTGEYKDAAAALLGSRGGIRRRERLSAEERRAIASQAARARWHPREVQAEKDFAQHVTHLIKQALKDGKGGQLPLG